MTEKKSPNWMQHSLSWGSGVMRKLKLGTVLDTQLAVLLIISPVAIIGFVITREKVLLIFPAATLAYFFRSYDYYMKRDPSLLRSEKHEQTMFRLAAGLGQKGNEVSEEKLDIMPSSAAPEASKLPPRGRKK